MAISYTDALRDTMMGAITTALDAGAGAGLLRIYAGTRPADADTALSGQTLLAELTLSDPSAAAPAAGVWTASSITADTSAAATDAATWFRVVDSNGNAVLDGDAGTSGSDLNLASTNITIGDTINVTAWSITEGNA